MVHGHPPRAEQTVDARQDRIQDHISREGSRGPDVAGISIHSGGVTALYQWLQRAALQRKTLARRVDSGPPPCPYRPPMEAPIKRNNEEKGSLESLTGRYSAGLLFPKAKLGPLYLSATLLCGNSKHLSHSSVILLCAYEEGDEAPLAATSGPFPPLKGIIKNIIGILNGIIGQSKASSVWKKFTEKGTIYFVALWCCGISRSRVFPYKLLYRQFMVFFGLAMSFSLKKICPNSVKMIR